MKQFKKLSAFACAIILVLSICVQGLFATAVTFDNNDLVAGTLHDSNPDYKFSWLNKLVLRDDATAFTTARIVPHPDYPYSRTFEEFMADIEGSMKLSKMDESTLTDNYDEIVELLYYTVVALGMTDSKEVMYKKLRKEGIAIPVNMTTERKIRVPVVYSALKYDLTYTLFGRKTEFTKGRSIEGATVDILSTITRTRLPSGVDTIRDFAFYCAETYLESFESLPMSESPTTEEIFYLSELLASAKKGYPVPTDPYEELTDAQKRYVDCTYYATVIGTLYDIDLDAMALAEAMKDNDVEPVARLVLETMLEQAGVEFEKSKAIENLFKLACENGLFETDEEFYSDVFNYDLYVDENCEKLWITPFDLCEQIGGNSKFLSIDANGRKLSPNVTGYVPLDKSKKTETVTISSNYEDDFDNSDMTVYVLTVHKEKTPETTSDNSVVSKIEARVNKLVPNDNEKANEIIGGVMGSVDEIVSKGESAITPNTENNITEPSDKASVITTYPSTTEESESTVRETLNTDVDFSYLDRLIGETYSSKDNSNDDADYETAPSASEKDANVITYAVETVKKNPEIVVVPTSIAAVGAVAGYLFVNKKKGNSKTGSTDSESDNK